MPTTATRWPTSRDHSGNAEGTYLTLNPVNPELLARAANRCRNWAKHTTGDADVLRRCWLPLDFDAVRPAGISSTDAEHKAAIKRAKACKRWLRGMHFPPKSLVLGDSGNGAHLLIRVNLPNDDAARELVKRCLEAAALQFSDESVKVDLTTYNAARIWKMFGTRVCKGDDIPNRPHRLARLLEVPEKIRPMKRHRLELLAATVPMPARPTPGEQHGAQVPSSILPSGSKSTTCPWFTIRIGRAGIFGSSIRAPGTPTTPTGRRSSSSTPAVPSPPVVSTTAARAKGGTTCATFMSLAGGSGEGIHRGSRCPKACRRQSPRPTGTALPTGSIPISEGTHP